MTDHENNRRRSGRIIEHKNEYQKRSIKKYKQQKQSPMGQLRSVNRKVWIAAGIAGTLLVIYLGLSFFFMNHFMFRTTINGKNFSGKTVDQVEAYVEKSVKNYKLILEEKENATESISGSTIALQYISNGSIKEALDKQKAFTWPRTLFQKKALSIEVEIQYNEETLDSEISKLKCITQDTSKSENAKPEYDGSQFVVADEVYGTYVDSETLTKAIKKSIHSVDETLNLEQAKCYPLPTYTKDSKQVKSACETLNSWMKASITYDFSTAKETIDAEQMAKFLTTNENMEADFNSDEISTYLKALAKKYDTVGTERSITTPTGKVATFTDGTYGWSIDRKAEASKLQENIKAAETVSREPEYSAKAAEHSATEWGKTYAEVDLGVQHMWYIKDGAVAFEADIVSGLPKDGRDTPTGIWDILEKKQNKTLTGSIQSDGTPEYETPVAYWMRITWTGVGFHTATWQPWFGGDRYKTHGSHGCINMSMDDSKTLYDMIQMNDPVIIHN